MRIARIAAVVMMVLVCGCAQAAPQAQTKMTVTGTLARAMATGGESTGWSIQGRSGDYRRRKAGAFDRN